MNRGQFYVRVLMGAGSDYRLGLALALTENERLAPLAGRMLVQSSRVLEKPTAAQTAFFAVATQGKR